MSSRLFLSVLSAGFLFPAAALAGDTGFFAGLDMSGGTASGSSSTKDGGAAFAGGGVVNNIKFGTSAGLGGHAGYRFNPAMSAFVSYQYIRGDVSWDADFPLYGVASSFEGTAISNVVMANLGYDFALSDATSLRTTAGLGLSFNSLSGVVETDVATGLFLSDVTDNTHASVAAQIGAGLQHRIAAHATVGVNASLMYTGGFETGSTRTGNLGVTAITPYKIDDVWRTSFGASLRFEF